MRGQSECALRLHTSAYVIVLGPLVEAAKSAVCVSYGNLLRIYQLLRGSCAHAAIDSCSDVSSVAQATAVYYCPHDGEVYEVRSTLA